MRNGKIKKAEESFTPSEAVNYIKPKVGLSRVYAMIAHGKFPNATKRGGRDFLIPLSDIEAENIRRLKNKHVGGKHAKAKQNQKAYGKQKEKNQHKVLEIC